MANDAELSKPILVVVLGGSEARSWILNPYAFGLPADNTAFYGQATHDRQHGFGHFWLILAFCCEISGESNPGPWMNRVDIGQEVMFGQGAD